MTSPEPAEPTLRTTPARQDFTVRLARSEADRLAAYRLRYEVFVTECGASGPGVDHVLRTERDRFDAGAEQILLCHRHGGTEDLVGTTRLIGPEAAGRLGGYYSEGEFDLAPLRASGRRLMELGRTCLHRDHRGGAAVHLVWQAIADHALGQGADLLFGTASLPVTSAEDAAPALSLLHHDYLAPAALRARSLAPLPVPLIPRDRLDARAAVRALPSLIKAYLRLGARVAEGAYLDRAFNCIDVLVILDLATVPEERRAALDRMTGA